MVGKRKTYDSAWDWASYVPKDDQLVAQVAEINRRFNQRLSFAVPPEVKSAIAELMDQARWIGGSEELRQFAQRLHDAIPEDVRRRISELRKDRQRELQRVTCRHYKAVAMRNAAY